MFGYKINFDFKTVFSKVFKEKGGFDVVIANPPYVKEAGNKSVFDGLRKSECYQGKMDFWYLFGCKGLDILKFNGVMCYIATNNWISNDGASKFRNKIVKQGRIINFVDFKNYKVFTAGIQTMVFIVLNNSEKKEYVLNYAELYKENADSFLLNKFLYAQNKISNFDFKKYQFLFQREILKDNYIKFIPFNVNKVIDKMLKSDVFFINDSEIFSTIDVMQDFVNKKHLAKLGNNVSLGDGIFVLNNEEKKQKRWNTAETKIIKPYYTTKEINRYYSNKSNRFWILYTRPEINNEIKNYPNIKKHLDKFQKVITSVNQPYGLHRTRKEQIFIGEKLLSIRKCPKPSFSFVDYPCYVSRAFLIIKIKRVKIKYLLAILNSRLISFWLFNKGKLQGNLFQVDKVPLMNIPIYRLSDNKQNDFTELVDSILVIAKDEDYLENSQKQAKVKQYERQIDEMVYKLYGLTEKEIKIVEEHSK